MLDSSPKLEISGASAPASYASISWTAVASLVIASTFVVLLIGLGLYSLVEKKPLIEQWLLFFPAITIVLAFVARRQIQISEGTRVGAMYASIAWWMATIGGLSYLAYLVAVEFTIRREADAAFVEFADHVKGIEPNNPNDEHLYGAMLMTVDPGLRAGANPRKPETMVRFREQLTGFQQTDVYRMSQRNRDDVTIKPLGLREWQQKPTEISCTLSAQLSCPEGEFELIMPMRAAVDDKKTRRWHILPSPDGYIKKANKTKYGWWIEYIDIHSRQFAGDFLSVLTNPGQSRLAYFGFVQPGLDPQRATHLLAWEVPAVAGGMSLLQPLDATASPPGAMFAKPGGEMLKPKDDAEAIKTLTYCWNTGRFLRSGSILKTAGETYPTISIDDAGITAAVPIEVAFAAEGAGGGGVAARGRVVLRFAGRDDPALLEAVLAARKLGLRSEMTERQPPDELKLRTIPWRVVRIESDLRPVSVPTSPNAGPPTGMGGQ